MKSLDELLTQLIALLAIFIGCVLLTWGLVGCAIGRVTTPSGQEVVGYALGNSFLESCLTPPPSDVGPEPRECATLKASTVTSLGEVLGAAISGAVLYFTGGL